MKISADVTEDLRTERNAPKDTRKGIHLKSHRLVFHTNYPLAADTELNNNLTTNDRRSGYLDILSAYCRKLSHPQQKGLFYVNATIGFKPKRTRVWLNWYAIIYVINSIRYQVVRHNFVQQTTEVFRQHYLSTKIICNKTGCLVIN